MKLKLNPSSVSIAIPPDQSLRDRKYLSYRVQLFGTMTEVGLRSVTGKTLSNLSTLTEGSFKRRVTTSTQEMQFARSGFDTLIRFRDWENSVPHVRSSGVVINGDMLAVVEDENGNHIYEFTESLRSTVKYDPANDNDSLDFCANDFVDILPEDEYDETDIVEIGLVKAQAFDFGVVQSKFITRGGFNPELLDFGITDFGTWNLIEGITYDGCKPDDIAFNRSQAAPTVASLSIIRV